MVGVSEKFANYAYHLVFERKTEWTKEFIYL